MQNPQKLKALQSLVLEKNKLLNLTSITDPEEFWQKHIKDSLEILEIPEIKSLFLKSKPENPGQVLDIGTGAGFPGLPLAIEYPNVQFILIDSTRKKVEAVNEFIAKLDICNAKAVWGRAEEITGDFKNKNKKLTKESEKFQPVDNSVNSKVSLHSYDLVLVRAIAYFPKAIELSLPYIKRVNAITLSESFRYNESGIILCYKTYSDTEKADGLKYAKQHGLQLVIEHRYGADRVIWGLSFPTSASDNHRS